MTEAVGTGTSPGADASAVEDLEGRLRRYPADRYPVQHATARFHLGVLLAERDDLPGAEEALATAAGLFDPRGLPGEHGKALNALGSVLRLAGRAREAAEVLRRAVVAFEAAELEAELAAAWFNLGLVLRERDDLAGAIDALARAHERFEELGASAHGAAAARELGTARFTAGDLEGARKDLSGLAPRAVRAGDEAGAGAAANVLGLVELAAGRPAEAVACFATAAGAHPRGLRPAEHAMAKANLALAHEAAGDVRHARLAAQQAADVPAAPDPVRQQAAAVRERLGHDPDDPVAVLEAEDEEQRAVVVRDELARWLDQAEAARRAEISAWIDGLLARPAAAVQLSVAWVGGLLEIPPSDLETVVRTTVIALSERDAEAQEHFRRTVASASARFHLPQLLRLRDTFNQAATDLGEEPAWR